MTISALASHRFATLLLAAALLASCGGSGSGSNGPASTVIPVPASNTPTLAEVGAAPTGGTALSTVCAGPADPAVVGAAGSARYPKAAGVFRGWPATGANTPVDHDRPLTMRADRSGGYVVAHATDAIGAMFRIATDGGKSVLPLPYATVFDVAADGRVWYAAGGTLAVGTLAGVTRTLATLGDGSLHADGPLGATPLGSVRQIAAGRDTVYLLVEDGTIDLGTQPPTSAVTRSLRVLTRAAPGQDTWTSRTVPLFADLQAVDVISAMRTGPADELVLLLNQPFKQLASQTQPFPGATQSTWGASASVRVMDTAGTWRSVADKPFTMSVVPSMTFGYLGYSWTLDVRDLSVTPGGTIWAGGAGGLYTVDPAAGWTRVAAPQGLPVDAVGQDGPNDVATFATAAQVVAGDDGVGFYDGETCQIRRLQGLRLSTVSGPRLAEVSVAGVSFLGQDAAGDLLFAYGRPDASDGFARGRYTVLPGLAKARIGDPAFVPSKVRSLASAIGAAACTTGSSYRASTGCAGAPTDFTTAAGWWLGLGLEGTAARIGPSIYAGIGAGPGRAAGSTSYWPGVLNGEAPSGPSGVHLWGDTLYQFGWVRTDTPTNPPLDYHVLRLYQFALSTGAATEVTGVNPNALVKLPHVFDYSSVIPTGGGGPALVQRRGDGKFWLCNGKELWLLDPASGLSRVAGLSASGSGADGVGDAASFASISSIRVLPDNRLLVVDRGAHAIRLATDDGTVRTLIGLLNRPATADAPLPQALPAALDTPVDAWAVGRDIYVSTASSRRLLKALDAL